LRRLLVTLPLATLTLLLIPAPASAATYTSNGMPCTKVGTAAADRLVGTSGKDVLCGLGGNDTLLGYGGDDVLDGGYGDDALSGGTGNDTLLGAVGNDRLLGEGGSDRLTAGAGNDRLYGGDGADSLAGQDGADGLSGGTGADREFGGAGNDLLVGGSENDVLYGNDGNDDLSGEGGSDAIDGGPGTNWCTVESGDTQNRCVYDTSTPTIGTTSASPAAVDVTYASKQVTLTAHVVDDTGIARVQFGSAGLGSLVSGTARDGTWRAVLTVARYSPAGEYGMIVDATDRVGRHVYVERSAFTVADDNPDQALPVAVSATLSADTVDVRTAEGSLTITAHLTDDASGVLASGTYACLHFPRADGSYGQLPCRHLTRYSGTNLDGYWRVTATVPQGSQGGDWNVSIWVTDAVHSGRANYYWGPDVYRYLTGSCSCVEPTYHELSRGRFAVLGTSDSYPPELVGLRVDRTSVDTLPSDQAVHVDVTARDAVGEGIASIGGYLAPEGGEGNGSPGIQPVDGRLVSGTAVDGVWRLTFTLPQGTPPGRYCLTQVWVQDKSHWRSWAPDCSPYAGYSSQQPVAPSQLTQADGSPWDGWVTVVDSSGQAP